MTDQQPATTELWAVHVDGPDSIIAAQGKAGAEAIAAAINLDYEDFKRRPTASKDDPAWHAEVVPWDGTAESHTRALHAETTAEDF